MTAVLPLENMTTTEDAPIAVPSPEGVTTTDEVASTEAETSIDVDAYPTVLTTHIATEVTTPKSVTSTRALTTSETVTTTTAETNAEVTTQEAFTSTVTVTTLEAETPTTTLTTPDVDALTAALTTPEAETLTTALTTQEDIITTALTTPKVDIYTTGLSTPKRVTPTVAENSMEVTNPVAMPTAAFASTASVKMEQVTFTSTVMPNKDGTSTQELTTIDSNLNQGMYANETNFTIGHY